MIDILKLCLQIALAWIPRAMKNAEDREYMEKLLGEALNHYQRRALDPATTRRASQDLDPILEEKWQQRFGNGGARPSGGA